ncbi:hypothetical protein EDD86DRAFT_275143 [Gorgonomyces haynaldii]|nr:hypothetical protein EDD86DRAFT_275143 [Gorgonomyces haynaldii]
MFGHLVQLENDQVYPVTSQTIKFGRDESCEMHVLVPSISRFHCTLSIDKSGNAFLVDTSQNGTGVNGMPIKTRLLEHGDVIHVGEQLYRFEYPLGRPVKPSDNQDTVLGLEKEKPDNVRTPRSKSSLLKGVLTKKDFGLFDQSPAKQARELKLDESPKHGPGFMQPTQASTKKERTPKRTLAFSPRVSKVPKTNELSDAPSVTKESTLTAAASDLAPDSLSNAVSDDQTTTALSKALENEQSNEGLREDDEDPLVVSTPTKESRSSPVVVKKTPLGKRDSPVVRRSSLLLIKKDSPLRTKRDSPLVKKPDPAKQNISSLTNLKSSSSLSTEMMWREIERFSVTAKPNLERFAFNKNAAQETAPAAEPSPRKSVTFGPPLSPEIFDKNKPPQTPVTRGRHASLKLKVNEDGSPAKSALKSNKLSARRSTSLTLEPRKLSSPLASSPITGHFVRSNSPEIAHSSPIIAHASGQTLEERMLDAYDEELANQQIDLPETVIQEDLPFVSTAEYSSNAVDIPASDISEAALAVQDVAAVQDVPDQDMSPAEQSEAREDMDTTQEAPEEPLPEVSETATKSAATRPDASTVHGSVIVKSSLGPNTAMSKTRKKSLVFVGLKEMFAPPKQPNTPTTVGLKEMFHQKPAPTPQMQGVKELFSQKPSQTPKMHGVKELFQQPKSNGTPKMHGVRELFQQPKTAQTPQMHGVKEMLKTPKRRNSFDYEGLEGLLGSPQISTLRQRTKSYENPQRHASMKLKSALSRSLQGTPVKRQMTPRFDGLSKLLKTPKPVPEIVYDGVAEMMKTPSHPPRSELVMTEAKSLERKRERIKSQNSGVGSPSVVERQDRTPKTESLIPETHTGYQSLEKKRSRVKSSDIIQNTPSHVSTKSTPAQELIQSPNNPLSPQKRRERVPSHQESPLEVEAGPDKTPQEPQPLINNAESLEKKRVRVQSVHGSPLTPSHPALNVPLPPPTIEEALELMEQDVLVKRVSKTSEESVQQQNEKPKSRKNKDEEILDKPLRRTRSKPESMEVDSVVEEPVKTSRTKKILLDDDEVVEEKKTRKSKKQQEVEEPVVEVKKGRKPKKTAQDDPMEEDPVDEPVVEVKRTRKSKKAVVEESMQDPVEEPTVEVKKTRKSKKTAVEEPMQDPAEEPAIEIKKSRKSKTMPQEDFVEEEPVVEVKKSRKPKKAVVEEPVEESVFKKGRRSKKAVEDPVEEDEPVIVVKKGRSKKVAEETVLTPLEENVPEKKRGRGRPRKDDKLPLTKSLTEDELPEEKKRSTRSSRKAVE